MGTNCPQCGAPIDPGADCCKYCGEKIAHQSNQNNVYQGENNSQPEITIKLSQENSRPKQVPDRYIDGVDQSWPIKSKTVAGILGILLGGLGVHKFYLGNIKMGVIYLLFCWTYIPAVLGVLEGIVYLCGNEHNFQVKHKVRIQ